ncbi:hypothetical protein Pmar_PMAR001407 [Perkinsus marinus ATCC 50983]|uniref:Uncharacterized protein n=1 Tax=Perkinsus marinus (strain ATCC 50983 / TXsc) TaxID=423536 RepID=C5KJM1_PERM5|nr:hypothetical protein Pmar_PMAR001407 [Perkinsus marinus ATCC 50983]EER15355.1 hypothetical protein Pmar_PMAR001407 [Perkinsus marinus ATCC 50983]|eukprot:XP_002783559.1 hypothetical protein Pmar_PMAR001407 [Perkinsus marinus ATCC 50983]
MRLSAPELGQQPPPPSIVALQSSQNAAQAYANATGLKILCMLYLTFDLDLGYMISCSSPDNPQLPVFQPRAFHVQGQARAVAAPQQMNAIGVLDLHAKMKEYRDCCWRVVCVSLSEGLAMMGVPVYLEDSKYERSSLVFCVAFIVPDTNSDTDDTPPWEVYREIAQQLAINFTRMELDPNLRLLSDESGRSTIKYILESVREQLNSCTGVGELYYESDEIPKLLENADDVVHVPVTDLPLVPLDTGENDDIQRLYPPRCLGGTDEIDLFAAQAVFMLDPIDVHSHYMVNATELHSHFDDELIREDVVRFVCPDLAENIVTMDDEYMVSSPLGSRTSSLGDWAINLDFDERRCEPPSRWESAAENVYRLYLEMDQSLSLGEWLEKKWQQFKTASASPRHFVVYGLVMGVLRPMRLFPTLSPSELHEARSQVITIDFPVDPPQAHFWQQHSGKQTGRVDAAPPPPPPRNTWPIKQAFLTREEQALARRQELLTMCNGSLSVDHIIEQFNERPERKGQAYRMMNRDEAFRLLEDAAKSDDIHLYLIWK